MNLVWCFRLKIVIREILYFYVDFVCSDLNYYFDVLNIFEIWGINL